MINNNKYYIFASKKAIVCYTHKDMLCKKKNTLKWKLKAKAEKKKKHKVNGSMKIYTWQLKSYTWIFTGLSLWKRKTTKRQNQKIDMRENILGKQRKTYVYMSVASLVSSSTCCSKLGWKPGGVVLVTTAAATSTSLTATFSSSSCCSTGTYLLLLLLLFMGAATSATVVPAASGAFSFLLLFYLLISQGLLLV